MDKGTSRRKVSVLIPCHNEAENLERLFAALRSLIEQEKDYDWEVLLVDDGSTDGTLVGLKTLRERDCRFAWISLSRNFGKEAAMLAGFDNVTGDCMVIMDADLQHPVSAIPDMLRLWEQGYDDVYGKRITRGKESFFRHHLSMAYYKLLQKVAKIDILPNVGDFRLLDRKCIDALRQLRETQRYTKGLYNWIGFKKKEVTFEQGDRTSGHSSFTYRKLFGLAVNGITSYTTTPLQISSIAGIIVSLVAFIYMLYVLVKTIIIGEPVHGFPTLVILILFLGGVQLISLGIIGEYLGQVFHEEKKRPVYIIGAEDGIGDEKKQN